MKDDILHYVRPKVPFLWVDEEHPLPNSYYLFRAEFMAEEKRPPVKIWISARRKYRLFLNDRLIGQGPPPAVEYGNIADCYPLGDDLLLRQKNCLAAEVQNMEGSSDAFFIIWLEDADGVLYPGITEDSVRVIPAPMWERDTQIDRQNSNVRYQECYDARRYPEGWRLPGFCDSDWTRPIVKVPLPLLLRDIPFLPVEPVYAQEIACTEESLAIVNRVRKQDLSIALSIAGKPVEYCLVQQPDNLLQKEGISRFGSSTVHQNHSFLVDGYYDPCIVLDFGKVMAGYFTLDVEGAEGEIIDVGYAERLVDGHFVNSLETLHCSARYILRKGRQQYRFYAWESFRFIKLRFRDCFTPVTVYSSHALCSAYPYEERGSFQCGVWRMNRLFEICRYTLRLCSQDFIMDTPWREQNQWCGDSCAVILGGIYACFGDVRLPGKFLQQTGMVQLPHGLIKFTTQSWDQGDWRSATVDYSLWWADALWNHYEYTGEIRWIRRYWPNVCKLIYALADQIDENGLLGDMPYKAFIDWALIDGVDWMKDCVLGENAFLNAQFFGVAEKMLRMAVLMGDQYMEGKLKQIRIGIRASFQERFFDIEKGCYVDANFNGRLSERVSEHSNMAAILWGLCEGDEAVAIAKKLLVDKTQPFTMAEPFGSAVTLRALDKIGLFKLAYQMLIERWGAWMVDKGLSSTPEEWGMNGSFRSGFYQGIMRSLSHAWSAEPARFLIQNTIGFQIVRPGCSEIQLCPVDIGTDYRIVCPLPQGDLTVESKDGKITCVVPDGVKLRQASLYGLSDRE